MEQSRERSACDSTACKWCEGHGLEEVGYQVGRSHRTRVTQAMHFVVQLLIQHVMELGDVAHARNINTAVTSLRALASLLPPSLKVQQLQHYSGHSHAVGGAYM